MKPFVEKLTLAQCMSFYAKTHETPLFDVGWHLHPEIELIFFKKGSGTAYIGDHIGEFTEGDIFIIGPNIAHTFQKKSKDENVSAVVIQFREDFWGDVFLTLPECRKLRVLFSKSQYGIKLAGQNIEQIVRKIEELENLDGVLRITGLIECLYLIECAKGLDVLSLLEAANPEAGAKDRLDMVYKFTIDNYFEQITLEQVARIAAMSIPAFCNHFKKSTRKTYIEFLNEVRIENACKLLVHSEKHINEIGFNSGFNTLANFNKQFYKVRKMTPSAYRKKYNTKFMLEYSMQY
jgi:AraC-like DNA-binding protein